MDTISSLPSEVHLIDIGLEYLLLGPLPLQVDGHKSLGELSHPELVRFQPEPAYQLHRECRRALFLPAIPHIHICRPDDSRQIEAMMIEEVLVFGRHDRMHENRRDSGEIDKQPLFVFSLLIFRILVRRLKRVVISGAPATNSPISFPPDRLPFDIMRAT